MPPIIIEVPPLSLAEYKSLNWAYMRKTRKSLLFVPIAMLSIIVINLFTSGSLRQPVGGVDIIEIGAYLAGAILFISFLVFRINGSINKNYLNSPALAEGIRVTLAEDTITQSSTSTSSETPWPASYKKATRIGHWLLLASSATSAYFLDTRGLKEPATPADLQELLHRKGITITS